MRQVITITPDGQVSGLQRKPGQGIDLRTFGHAKIERVSEIEFVEALQRWRISVLRGPFAGRVVTSGLWIEQTGDVFSPAGADLAPRAQDALLFVDYDDAVKAEIAFLDAARLKGSF